MQANAHVDPGYGRSPGDRRAAELRLTQEGLGRLEQALRDLEDRNLPEVAERIREIKASSSDLADSVEYTEALDDLARLQLRAAALREMIGSGEVIAPGAGTRGSVTIGSTVSLRVDGHRETYQVVGVAEADPLAGRISEASPLGRALLGRRGGDRIEWQAPDGPVSAEVVRVS